MELEKFISESLLQIHSALKKVNIELSKDYPQGQKKNLFLLRPGADKEKGEGIHFDLAITAKTETTGKKGVKARVYVVEGGLGKENKVISENISRISFSLNVQKWVGTFHKPPKK